MAQGVILSDKSRDGIAALVWRNMGDLEEDMWEREQQWAEQQEMFEGMQAALEQAGLRVLNRPNLLKQNFWTSRQMPSSAVIVEELTVPAEDATAAAQPLTFTITNQAITSSYVLHGVKSSDFNVVAWNSVTGTFSAGSATITIAARSGAHNEAVTVKVALCTQSSQNVPYGDMSRTSGSSTPYLKSIYSGWYPGDDTTDNIYVSVASLAAADQITEPDGETYDKALQYSITANSAYGNTEWLQYNYANHSAGYYQGNTPRNYGHIDELIPGETYTVSCWARVISGDGAWMRFGWGGNYGNAPYTDNDKMGRSDWVVIEGAEWKRYSWTFTFNPQGTWFTETSSEVTVNNETKTYITRTYAWNKSVWFGIGRKFTSVVQLCGFRLVRGKLWVCDTYDDLEEQNVSIRQRLTAVEGTVEDIPASIQAAKDAVNANVTAAEETTATEAHAVGDVISVGGQLYVVTAAIEIGDTIAEGTNVENTTVMAQMAKKASESDLLSLYTGVAEYTPTINPVFAPGIFYHQTGTNYIGVIKSNNLKTLFNLSGVEIPSESDSNWDIMYFGNPGLKEAMMFPIPGITEYTPAESLDMDANTFYHEVGSKYVCVLNDTYLPKFSEGGDAGVSGGRTFGASPVYHLPITSTNYINVYTLGSFMSAWRHNRVSKSNPIFSGELSIQGAKLSRETMLTLLGLINNNGTYDTPPTTIKLGSTTITEAQLQALLATLE